MNAKNPVLLPIDMQKGFEQGSSWPASWNSRCDENGLALLAHWRANHWPIVHVRHDSTEEGSSLAPGQSGNDFKNGFGPEANELLISKSVNSAFIGTDLELQLKSLQATELIFFGITTDQCVSTSVRMGSNLGWSCVLVEDACNCFDLPGPGGKTIPAAEIHAAHIATLGFEFCRVTTTEALIVS